MNVNSNVIEEVLKFKEISIDDYFFQEVASEMEIEKFEKKFNIRLPEDYRWFILNIANGIKAKKQYDIDFVKQLDFQNFKYREHEHNPSIPFELTSKVCFNDGYYNEDYARDDYPYEVKVDYDGEIRMTDYRNGEILITISHFLIVNGKEYGNVWVENETMEEIYPAYDLTENKSRLKFNDWLCKKINNYTQQFNSIIEYENGLKEKAKLKYQIEQEARNQEREDRLEEYMNRKKYKRDLLTRVIDFFFK